MFPLPEVKVDRRVKVQALQRESEFLQVFYVAGLAQVQQTVRDTNVVLSMDNNWHLDLDSILSEVKAPYQEISQRSEAESQELRVTAGRKGGDLKVTEVEVSELNEGIERLRAEIANLKDQVGNPLDRGSLWGLQLG
ncbi:hypothetical protein mRhiFer1_008060 [Rhinolophus ferrumequinum]|uniref:IF rod domain-containing protein n=1 Tax=Rhinolophus ferrumequinum TaxID=59479 RepID=A0A7J7WR81_RHIFE|nr:hypothetical protein mRhiFer1_008060 [Rhinolophus ferrumequinum]